MRLTGGRGRSVDKKTIRIAVALGALAAAAAGGVALWRSQVIEPDVQPRTASSSGPSASAPERFASLPVREPIGKPRGQPFDPRSWEPERRPAPVVAAPPPPKPTAPPIPYRIAGQVSTDGVARVALARDDRIFTVGQGDTLDGTYRVEAITPDGVTLIYLPLSERQQLQVAGLRLDLSLPTALAGATAAPGSEAAEADVRPAQLRWEGPKEVHAGANFDVTLKLTSAQPVRALPLQVSYDAKLLEAIAVRPGDLFTEGRFSYRVAPGGSIFVGVSTNEPTPADADLMVVTFRPIRSGDAELRLSSVALQGAAGRAIAHEPPATFRTAIVQ